MIDILKCLISLLVLLAIFYFWGSTTNNIIKLHRKHWIEKILIGFLLYFSIFQFYVLPMIFSKKSFTTMCVGWIVVFVLISVALFLISKKRGAQSVTYPISIDNIKLDWHIVVFIILLLVLIKIDIRPYFGWDTVHYVGIMNESIYTDTMYQFHADNGNLASSQSFRDYLNSGFFMQFAFISKVISIKPITCAYYLMRSLGFVLFVFIVYLIGLELLEGDSVKASAMACVAVFMGIMFNTYLSSEFFNSRLYEGKGYCQNVLIPLTFYCLIKIYKEYIKADEPNKSMWIVLFLLGLANVPISMSSVLIFPFMVGIGCASMWIAYPKKIKILVYGLICTIPNMVYLVVYYTLK